MKSLPAPLTDSWFEAEFYGGIFEDKPCDGVGCSVVSPHTSHSGYLRQGSEIEGAQGLFLYCPCAYGTEKAHGLLIPFSNPRNAPLCPPNHGPESRDGKIRPRWAMEGTGLHDLLLSPSIAVGEPECFHGHISGGIVK
jgi:hypothetical protein